MGLKLSSSPKWVKIFQENEEYQVTDSESAVKQKYEYMKSPPRYIIINLTTDSISSF